MVTSFAIMIIRFCIQLFSILFNCFKLAYHHFKWFLEFLTYSPFYSLHVHHHHLPPEESFQIVAEERVEIWRPREGEEEVDCAVCLSKIGEGDEVRVLRCEHVFHRNCLNQWVGFRNFTCPLCRDFLGSGIRNVVHGDGGGTHVIFFRFSSFFEDNSERENWWLRHEKEEFLLPECFGHSMDQLARSPP
ncbi:RING-H2 finger protein ATL14-like [Neltuma alba]|uniref:RING-H2 finger protein ATL14-like n=1 Tax=Neltuma alba TaxID=207710 RepID=UPI0010A36D5B|nr:RING-H2 finger protein ATL14-like [Prosopis alba]